MTKPHYLYRAGASSGHRLKWSFTILVFMLGLISFDNSMARDLLLESAPAACGAPPAASPAPPAAAAQRIENSQVVSGQKDIAWAWLGSPTARYPHAALGSRFHAASLHVMVTVSASSAHRVSETAQELVYTLPLNRVFEDRTLRLVDLDRDGRDEIIVVESDVLRGSSLVVLGLQAQNKGLLEIARSPYTGSSFRWLNPLGVADFDNDGRLDIAAVITPHVGGVLTLYHFRPPRLVPYATLTDTSNHRMGSSEQQLGVIVEQPGLRPTIIVPDMSLKALHVLRWEKSDARSLQEKPDLWHELANALPLPARVERITALPGGACVMLADGSWQRLTMTSTGKP